MQTEFRQPTPEPIIIVDYRLPNFVHPATVKRFKFGYEARDGAARDKTKCSISLEMCKLRPELIAQFSAMSALSHLQAWPI